MLHVSRRQIRYKIKNNNNFNNYTLYSYTRLIYLNYECCFIYWRRICITNYNTIRIKINKLLTDTILKYNNNN